MMNSAQTRSVGVRSGKLERKENKAARRRLMHGRIALLGDAGQC
jgi:hypothetical protein